MPQCWEFTSRVAITGNAFGGQSLPSEATLFVQERGPRLRLALHEVLPHGLGGPLLLHVGSEIPGIKSLHSTAQWIAWG